MWSWFAVGALAALAAALTLLPADPVARFAWHAPGMPLHAWLTAHFVHLGPVHLGLDLLALLALSAIAWRHRYGAGMLVAFAVSLLAVNVGLLAQWWPIAWYAGLSGALHGVFAWLCLRLARDTTGWPQRLALLVWLGALGKVLAEAQIPAGTPGVAGFPLALPAHAWGYAGGSLWAVVTLFRRSAK